MDDFMISVIIPVFNVEDYLHICLNSVLNQSYGDFEVICIDDDSTDSSLEILEYFAEKDSRIKILKNDSNMGPGYSRNRGLNIAKGKYIAFLDGDDWISYNAFEILLEKSEKDNLDVLMFRNIVYYQNSKEFGMESYYDMDYLTDFESKVFNHWDLDKKKFFSMSNAPWNKFYLKSFLDDNNIRFTNKNLIYEDNPFFYKVITLAKRVSIIKTYLHNRRRRPESITTLTNERLLDSIEICYLIIEIFLENPQLYEYYKKQILTFIFVSVLNDKYELIDDEYKKKFFNKSLEVYDIFYNRYNLKQDIFENVNKDVLKKFHQII